MYVSQRLFRSSQLKPVVRKDNPPSSMKTGFLLALTECAASIRVLKWYFAEKPKLFSLDYFLNNFAVLL